MKYTKVVCIIMLEMVILGSLRKILMKLDNIEDKIKHLEQSKDKGTSGITLDCLA